MPTTNAAGVDLAGPLKQAQGLANQFLALLPNLLLAAIVLAVAYVMGKYAARFVRAVAHRTGQAASVGLLLGRLATYVVVVFGVLVALSTVFPSFTANSLVQTLGIGGVAVGFAFKDIFQNFLAGVIILISRPFRIGDAIAVKGYEGTVEDIQTRATMIRTYDNQRIVIPNSTVFTQEVKVISAFESRRVEVEFTLDYGADLERAKTTIVDALRSIEGIDESPAPDVLAMNFGDSGLVLRMRYWITPSKADFLKVRDAAMTAVKNALQAAKLSFPISTVVVRERKEGADDVASERWASGGAAADVS